MRPVGEVEFVAGIAAMSASGGYGQIKVAQGIVVGFNAFPPATSSRGTLHFICRRAGAGKTMLARELGRTLPAVVFCEDEWIETLGFDIQSLDDFGKASSKCLSLIGPLATELLRLGVSVVFDFSGNAVRSRQWVRTIFETANADQLLHVIEATDSQCLANIHMRNHEKPSGVYWSQVTDETFHRVTVHFAPPQPEEGFCILTHVAFEPLGERHDR